MVHNFTSGVMADYDSQDETRHVALCYMTNNYDYTVYTVSAKGPDFTYWSQWENQKDATADYNDKWEKLFKGQNA